MAAVPGPSGSVPAEFKASRRYGLPVELRQLEAFVAAANELHFGRAAEHLTWPRPRSAS